MKSDAHHVELRFCSVTTTDRDRNYDRDSGVNLTSCSVIIFANAVPTYRVSRLRCSILPPSFCSIRTALRALSNDSMTRYQWVLTAQGALNRAERRGRTRKPERSRNLERRSKPVFPLSSGHFGHIPAFSVSSPSTLSPVLNPHSPTPI